MAQSPLLLCIVFFFGCLQSPSPVPSAIAAVVDTGQMSTVGNKGDGSTTTRDTERHKETREVAHDVAIKVSALAFFLEDKKALENKEISTMPGFEIYKIDPRCHAGGPHGLHTVAMLEEEAAAIKTSVDTAVSVSPVREITLEIASDTQ